MATKTEVMQRYGALAADRSSFESLWRDLIAHYAPRRGRWGEESARGAVRTQKIVNSKGTRAARTLASGFLSGMSNPARPWFRPTIADPELADQHGVRVWLDEVANRMRDVLLRSNFYSTAPLLYFETAVLGTSAMIMVESLDDVVRFDIVPSGAYFASADEAGRVSSFAFEFTLTPSAAVSRFGIDRLSQAVRDQFSRGNEQHSVNFIQLIEPNEAAIVGSAISTNLPIRSVVIEKGGDIVEEKGFNEHPILLARWERMQGTAYGTDCPGMLALGDVKQLQFTEVRSAEVLDKINTPPIEAPAGLINRTVSLLPGKVTYRPALQSGDATVRPIFSPDPRAYQFSIDKINSLERRISESFFEDLILMLQLGPDTQRTATEIIERREERLVVFGPVLEQMTNDVFDPMIDRLFGIMERRGMIPEAPPELQGAPLTIEYTSIMAQAQRALGLSGIERLMQFAGGMAQMYPEVRNTIDPDEVINEYAIGLGVQTKLIRSDEDIAEIREAEAQAQARQQQMEALSRSGGAMDALSRASQAVPAEGNLAGTVMSALSESGVLQ